MLEINKQLEEYDLTMRESDSPDRQLIDFDITDGEDNVFWCWGDNAGDIDWECNHPYQAIDFGDGDEQCECRLCGSFGDYHYIDDEDGNRVPEPYEWHPRKSVGGIVGDYIDVLRGGADEQGRS